MSLSPVCHGIGQASVPPIIRRSGINIFRNAISPRWDFVHRPSKRLTPLGIMRARLGAPRCISSRTAVHIDKSFRNPIKSTQIQILNTIRFYFDLIRFRKKLSVCTPEHCSCSNLLEVGLLCRAGRLCFCGVYPPAWAAFTSDVFLRTLVRINNQSLL